MENSNVGYLIGRVSGLAERLSDGSLASRAMLSKLRRAAGKRPGSDPEIWAAVLGWLPDGLSGHGGEPSYGEWAVHTALTLYAVHAQSSDMPAHVAKVDFGSAAGKLAASYAGNSETGNPYQKRMAEIARAEDIEVLSWRLRSMVRLLGQAGAGFDYGRFAADLYMFQFLSKRPDVVLKWGRGYSAAAYKLDGKSNGAGDMKTEIGPSIAVGPDM